MGPHMMVLGAGLVTADIVQLANGDWEPTSDRPSYAAGGTVCNVLCHLARTGWHCELIGGVGNDTLGHLVLDDLDHFRVGLRAVRVIDGKPTRRIGQLVSLDRTKFGLHRFFTRCGACRREIGRASCRERARTRADAVAEHASLTQTSAGSLTSIC